MHRQDCFLIGEMKAKPARRVELLTGRLQIDCSATELRRQRFRERQLKS